ncbi:MAG: hypothetical protein HY901_21530 [Deltaproteobacteria bacterium]|nr:hypothetical protein [Deltaproteobacteria bacterium]
MNRATLAFAFSSLALLSLLMGGLAACLDGSADAALGPMCQEYLGPAGCCLSAAGNDAAAIAACQRTAEIYRTSPAQWEDSCKSALDQAIARGVCARLGSDAGTNLGNDAGTAVSISPACTRFIACTSAVAPDQSAGTLAAYGPEGSCWKTTSTKVCSSGCATGLEGLHRLHPEASACALCVSDSECSGATPGCDPIAGECVTCTRDSHCSGPTPACDVATHQCVACNSSSQCPNSLPACHVTAHQCVQCNSSSQCTNSLPACDVTSHRCVECIKGTDCDSGRCESNHTCCVPEHVCDDANKEHCGSFDNGCGTMLSCGSCSVGTCHNDFNYCETYGDPCTPGAASCAKGESCQYDYIYQWGFGYRCRSGYKGDEGDTCTPACGWPVCYADTSECRGSSLACFGSMTVGGGKCRLMCLTNEDCPGTTCHAPVNGYPISESQPGVCF